MGLLYGDASSEFIVTYYARKATQLLHYILVRSGKGDMINGRLRLPFNPT